MLSSSGCVEALRRWECRDASYLAADPPLVFARGKGSLIWDLEGNRYIDLCAGFGVLALGHNSDIQANVFRSSISDEALVVHGMGDVYPSVAKAELLAYLGELLPSHLTRGSLALSGGQAIELAVKTAQISTRQTGFISFQGSYHGLDLGILPLTSKKDFKSPFEAWLPNCVEELPYGCSPSEITKTIRQMRQTKAGCAAIIVEPIQGRAGVRMPPVGWLHSLADIAKRESVLLIFDEIFTGLGRTGRLTYAEEVTCDLLCLGKALGGGLPLSACFGREEVMNAWPENTGEAIHTGTFFGHPLSCRLGLASLQHIVDRQLSERAKRLGSEMRKALAMHIGSHPLVHEIRGEGLMTGIELRKPGLGAAWMDQLRGRGIIALANGMNGEGLSLTPALTLEESIWEEALSELASSLKSLV